jgi:hypothetical protein
MLMNMSPLKNECVETILNADGMGELHHMVLMFASAIAPNIGDV